MSANLDFAKCLTFINCQLTPSHAPVAGLHLGEQRRAVTISRQSGSGAHEVAESLAACLQAQTPADERPWTVFDKNLVERVLEDHHLPTRLAKFMPESRVPAIADALDELFGVHPPSFTLVRQTAETVLRLAELGNVILIGRGANIITNRLPYMIHVRLVGSPERRAERIQEARQVSPKIAWEMMGQEDRDRARYFKMLFDKDVSDPLLYHLVINTDQVACTEAARLIAEAVWAQRVPELASAS